MRSPDHRSLAPVLLAASLGYFVDVYDLIIFSVVRTQSLADLGVASADTLRIGLHLLNLQVAGVLLGGPFWGILGDKLGRRSVLFGSIILYSVANLANAYITTIPHYEILRFVAGVGLAGELGAGVTLVSEIMPAARRGYGTMLIASVGLLGALVASLCGIAFNWRTAYLIGALMGFVLLLLRVGVAESPLFKKAGETNVPRGNLFALLRSGSQRLRLVLCTLAGMPSYFVIGILITASPEVGRFLGLQESPVAGVAIMASYLAMSIGGVACSGLSQRLASRRKAIAIFHGITAAAIALYLFVRPHDLAAFYGRCALLGFGIGVWTLVVTNAAEQFGTNIRATAATIVPNLIRAMLIPISWSYQQLAGWTGQINALALIGFACIALALGATWRMGETFGRSLDFMEK